MMRLMLAVLLCAPFILMVAAAQTPDQAEIFEYLDTGSLSVEDSDDANEWSSVPLLPGELVYLEKRRAGGRGSWRGGGGKREGSSSLESRYVCRPSREDVLRLLLALHDARGGNAERVVNFCNHRRPASNILTNLRFLG